MSFKKPFAFRMSDEIQTKLQQLAQENGLSMSDYLRQFIVKEYRRTFGRQIETIPDAQTNEG